MIIREEIPESISMYNYKKMNISIDNIISCVIDDKKIVLKMQDKTFKMKMNSRSVVNIEYE